MILQEKYNEDLIRTYSDENKRIIQVETGYIYDDAIDVKDSNYTYIESDQYILNGETTIFSDEI